MKKLLALFVAAFMTAPAFAQMTAPTAPVVNTTPKDYGSSSACEWVPPTGLMGNFHALRAMDCVLIKSDATGPRTLQDIVIDRSRDGITNYVSSRAAIVSGLTIQRFDISSRKRGVYLRGKSNGIVIRDGVVRGQGVNTNDGDIPMGVMIGMSGGKADSGPSDVLVERVTSRDHLADYAGYANADGFVSERDVTRLTFRDTVAINNTDGCYDLKSAQTVLERTSASLCRYGYRLWNTGHAGYIIADSNRNAAVQMAATSTNWTIDYLDVRGPDKDIEVNVAGGTLVIKACSAPVRVTGSASAIKATTIALGPGCRTGDKAPPIPAILLGDLVGLCTFPTKLPDNNNDGIIDLGAANRTKCQGVSRVKLMGQNLAKQYVYSRYP